MVDRSSLKTDLGHTWIFPLEVSEYNKHPIEPAEIITSAIGCIHSILLRIEATQFLYKEKAQQIHVENETLE